MARVDPKVERLRVVPLFRACTDDELAGVARVADEVVARPGEQLVRMGGLGHEFFVIVEGSAQVRQEGRAVATLGPGDYFGELALLGEPRRDAEVVAETGMTLLVVGAREFGAMLDGAPAVARAILRGMARRLQQADLARA